MPPFLAAVDPLAAVIGVVAIAVALFVWRSRAGPRLTYSMGATSLVFLHREAEGRVTIAVDGEPVHAAHLLYAEFLNTGTKEILEKDFKVPLRIDLGKGGVALAVEVAETQPAGLKVHAAPELDHVVVQGMLLNPGDGFALKAWERTSTHRLGLSHRGLQDYALETFTI